MIEQGIEIFIKYCNDNLGAEVTLNDKQDLYVNGTLVMQDLTTESLNETKRIWLDSGLSEQSFYTYFENFITEEIQRFLRGEIEPEVEQTDKEE